MTRDEVLSTLRQEVTVIGIIQVKIRRTRVVLEIPMLERPATEVSRVVEAVPTSALASSVTVSATVSANVFP